MHLANGSSASEEGRGAAVGLHGEEQGGCLGRGVVTGWCLCEAQPHSAQQPAPGRTSIPNPLPSGKPAHRKKMPWVGQWDKHFLFLAIPRNSSFSGRLGQGALQSHCVLAKCLGNAEFPIVNLVKVSCTPLLPQGRNITQKSGTLYIKGWQGIFFFLNCSE